MQFCVLASGSNGNCLYLESGDTRILLDAGLSGRQLETRLRAQCERELREITAVLVTHEHDDHVKGLVQVAKKSEAPLFMTEGTYAGLPAKARIEERDRVVHIRPGESFVIGNVRVTPFSVSHDAEEPVAFRFDTDDGSLAVVTDLGYVSDHQRALLQGCDVYVFETNHDTEMLRAGPYPWHLKRRILGDKGHLSNVDAAYALIDILGESPAHVYLAHLSGENNLPELAELTVEQIVFDARPELADRVQLHRTSRQGPCAAMEISRATV
ncbi:MBL fold metallo-hydrolase [Alicyclobacillus vulcanalis]|uniref:Phosphoribosyl 1,2-cyclic phosphodiesterase n=1 Tax=Alicyclobacillus vulcanalis TaxID=252246 RepID=A0A1N7LN64_9BACL|nr:MBL fold metallo-hydrolase [Alicyclobacillus vulcanalis]SIS75222.1 Phosphoribosyl 1,2-cyclic phosphodiesterase [Alicyclobacillus vulcanalis]